MTRTTSFMARHRTICAVLEEIKQLSVKHDRDNFPMILVLIDEAITYAKRMDAKLVEIRTKESEGR